MQKKLTLSSELAYVLATVIFSFALAMTAAADFGVNMVVAPSYILSLKFTALSFGQCEYLMQGAVFILMCLLLRRLRPLYLASFVSCLFYGAVLDLIRAALPALNPVDGRSMAVRVTFFIVGNILTEIAIALYFRPYIYPQVYDFFVKKVSAHFGIDRGKFKWGYDAASLAVACVLTLLLFGRFEGIGAGTLIVTVINGPAIAFFDRLLGRYVEVKPTFPGFAALFTEEGEA